MPHTSKLPNPPAAERTPLVEQLLEQLEELLEQVQQQAETIQRLRDEIAVLKGEKPKPTIKPSGMEQNTAPADSPEDSSGKGTDNGKSSTSNKRPGSDKRHRLRR